MTRMAYTSSRPCRLINKTVLCWAGRMTSALAREELIIRPEVKLNLRPRKCHTPNSKPVLLHNSLACISSSPGPVAQLLSCYVTWNAWPHVREESSSRRAAIPEYFRKSRQLIFSPSTGTSHSHPRWAKGSSAVRRGRAAGAEPGGDKTRTALTACEQQELRRLCKAAHKARVRGHPLFRAPSPTEYPPHRNFPFPSAAGKGHPAAVALQTSPGSHGHQAAAGRERPRSELWLKQAFLSSRLSFVLDSAEGHFLQ